MVPVAAMLFDPLHAPLAAAAAAAAAVLMLLVVLVHRVDVRSQGGVAGGCCVAW
jgi:hypothetical protein